MVYGVIDFLQKTNEWIRFYYLVCDVLLFVFWRKSTTSKNLFEINWPLRPPSKKYISLFVISALSTASCIWVFTKVFAKPCLHSNVCQILLNIQWKLAAVGQKKMSMADLGMFITYVNTQKSLTNTVTKIQVMLGVW